MPATKTIVFPYLLMVRADMPEPLAHDVIALMFEHKAQLAEVHRRPRSSSSQHAQSSSTGVELQPGAERFYREAGRSEARGGWPLAGAWPSPAAGCGASSPRARARDARRPASLAEARTARRRAIRALLPALRLPGAATERFRATGDGFGSSASLRPSAAVIDDYDARRHPHARRRHVGHDACAPRALRDHGARRHRPRAAHARSPGRNGSRSRARASTSDSRWRGHDRSDHRPDPRRVRGRAARTQARGFPARLVAMLGAGPERSSRSSGSSSRWPRRSTGRRSSLWRCS